MKALEEQTPAQIIETVMHSGLRGRGGSGYLTGLKWSTVAKASGDRKYVICNADEGDRARLWTAVSSKAIRTASSKAWPSQPMQLAPTMLSLCARRVSSRRQNGCGARFQQAEKRGFLGTGIAGTPFNFHVELRLGAGAFVCGEETALMASIEGKSRQATSPATLPGRVRSVGQADADQQRRDLRLYRADPAQRRRLVRRHRHRAQQRHQSVCAGR